MIVSISHSALRRVLGVLFLLTFAWALAGPPCRGQSYFIPDVLYLKLNEGGGTATADAALPGVGSAPTVNTSLGWATSPILGSGCLDATSPLPVPTGCSFVTTNQAFTLTGSWTIEALIRPGVVPLYTYLPLFAGLNGNQSFSIAKPLGGTELVLLKPGFTPVALTGALVAGTWAHVAWVHDAATLRITPYLNGVAQPSVAQPGPLSITTDSQGLYVGYNPAVANFSFRGAIDEVRLWSRVRTASELQSEASVELPANMVRSIRLSWPQPVLAFNASAGTFGLAGAVESVGRFNGPDLINPQVDPLIGATVIISGSYTGTDLAGLSDIALTSTNVMISAVPGADDLSFSTQFSTAAGGPSFDDFSGQLKSEPAMMRPMGGGVATSVTRTGSSYLLDGLEIQLVAAGVPSLVFALTPSGPVLSTIEVDFVPPAATPRRVFATDGAGRADIGILDLQPLAPIYNIFAINPSTPLGAGPFVGLEFGLFQINQLVLPFPTPPFKTFASFAGTYYFFAPSGSVPAGLVVDLLSAAVDSATGNASLIAPISRLHF